MSGSDLEERTLHQHEEYLQKLKLPTPERFKEIAEYQEKKWAAGVEEKRHVQAARLIQVSMFSTPYHRKVTLLAFRVHIATIKTAKTQIL